MLSSKSKVPNSAAAAGQSKTLPSKQEKQGVTVDELAEQLSQLLDEFMYNVVSAADQHLDSVIGYDVMMDRYDEMVSKMPTEYKKGFDERLASIISGGDVDMLRQHQGPAEVVIGSSEEKSSVNNSNSVNYESGFNWADCDQDFEPGSEPSAIGYARLPSSAGSSPRKSQYQHSHNQVSSPKRTSNDRFSVDSLKSAVETVLAENEDEVSLKRRNSMSVSRAASKRKKKPRKKPAVSGATAEKSPANEDPHNDDTTQQSPKRQSSHFPHVASPKASMPLPPLLPVQHGYDDVQENFADFKPVLSRQQIKNRNRAANKRSYANNWRPPTNNEFKQHVHKSSLKQVETVAVAPTITVAPEPVRVDIATMTDQQEDLLHHETNRHCDEAQQQNNIPVPIFNTILDLMKYNYEQALMSAYEQTGHCIVYEARRF